MLKDARIRALSGSRPRVVPIENLSNPDVAEAANGYRQWQEDLRGELIRPWLFFPTRGSIGLEWNHGSP
jgi:hypothetical protein